MNFLNARQSGAAEPSPKAQNKQLSKRRKAAEDDERISRFFGSTVNSQRIKNHDSARGIGDERHRRARATREKPHYSSSVVDSSAQPIDLPEVPFLGFGKRGPRPASKELDEILASAVSLGKRQPARVLIPSTSLLSWSKSPDMVQPCLRHGREANRRILISSPSIPKDIRPSIPHQNQLANQDGSNNRPKQGHTSTTQGTILSSEGKENHPPRPRLNITPRRRPPRSHQSSTEDMVNKSRPAEREKSPELPQPKLQIPAETTKMDGQLNSMSKPESPPHPDVNRGTESSGLDNQDDQGLFTQALDKLIDKWKDKVMIPTDVVDSLRNPAPEQKEKRDETEHPGSLNQDAQRQEQIAHNTTEPPQALPTPPLMPSPNVPASRPSSAVQESHNDHGISLPGAPNSQSTIVLWDTGEAPRLPLPRAPAINNDRRSRGPHATPVCVSRPASQPYVQPVSTRWREGPSIYERQMQAEESSPRKLYAPNRLSLQSAPFIWAARPSASRPYGTPQSLESTVHRPHQTSIVRQCDGKAVSDQTYHDDDYNMFQENGLLGHPSALEHEHQWHDLPEAEGIVESPYDFEDDLIPAEDLRYLTRPDSTLAGSRHSPASFHHRSRPRRSASISNFDIGRPELTRSAKLYQPEEREVTGLHTNGTDDHDELAGFWKPNVLY